ncbi:hypothetical protein BG006_000901 [Podila minutissima]|uniref:Magnesium-transporting ATPase, P-type 1 n=1 Tax=Podila minutissima TaxID=64525 RepID=A0A9P5SD13_9FUNG|nr:hypothetical protein BG006_000901 [Podila minutissima]
MTSLSQAALDDKAIKVQMGYFGFGTNTSPVAPDDDYGHGLQPLNEEQVERALATHGKNIVKTSNDQTWYRILFGALIHPFNILLVILAVTSLISEDDVAGATIMFTMVAISALLRFWQEWKSASAAQALRSLASVMVTVIRRYSCPSDRDPTPEDVARMSNLIESDIKMEDLFPGDWVKLSAGDMIPADVIVLESTDLLVSEAGLTGESMPIEKFAEDSDAMARYKAAKNHPDAKKNSYEAMASDAIPMRSTAIDFSSAEPKVDMPKPSAYTVFKRSAKRSFFACFGIRRFESDESAGFNASQELDRSPTRCYMGTSVVSGSATVLVDKTGSDTFFGSMAKELSKKPTESAFQMGIRTVSWMLPMIVNSNLARGAYLLSRGKRCIVKNSDAIVNLGAMNILCTDKTGTLTNNKVVMARHLDFSGKLNIHPLQLAFLNARFQTGLKNPLDKAVIEYFSSELPEYDVVDPIGNGKQAKAPELSPAATALAQGFYKMDEIPFDFVRRRMTVVLKDMSDESCIMISKGAVDEMLSICNQIAIPTPLSSSTNSDSIVDEVTDEQIAVSVDLLVHPDLNQIQNLTLDMKGRVIEISKELNIEGLRVVAVGYRPLDRLKDEYGVADEREMVFAGLLAFLDPSKESTGPAIKELLSLGVEVKILTGDSAAVCRKVCQEIKLPLKSIVTSEDLIGLEDDQVADMAEGATIFAKLTPLQKSQVIRALKRRDHIVGFLGDGVNDAPALAEADVGIAVDAATDIAKDSANVILLEKSLDLIVEAVLLGRTTYGNTMKYIVMAISSNFGNVFSVLVASSWLPFLPMLPIHILAQNLLYDISQTAIPWDHMDPEFLQEPRRWSIRSILRFMVFIGPWSSIFDITTFLFMWFQFDIKNTEDPLKVLLFQTAWFTEGALSQTLVVHFIRTPKIPFIQSMAAWPLVAGSLIISGIVLVVPYIGPIANWLSLVHLPGIYYSYLVLALLCYCFVTQGAKMLYLYLFKAWF